MKENQEAGSVSRCKVYIHKSLIKCMTRRSTKCHEDDSGMAQAMPCTSPRLMRA